MSKVLRNAVIGGGVAGLTLSLGLSDSTLFDSGEYHIYQPSLLYTSLYGKDEKKRSIARIYRGEFRNEKVKKIDLDDRRIISNKNEYTYDRVIICTGTYPDPGSIEGLGRLAEDSGDFVSSYTNAMKVYSRISSMKSGTIVTGITYPVYRFPPVAIEFTILLEEILRKRGVRKNFEIKFISPFIGAYPARVMDSVLTPIMKERGIEIISPFNVDRIDVNKREIYSLEGDSLIYDHAFLVPPFRGTDIIDKCVNEDGFINTDKEKLNIKGYDDAFALGDVTSIPSAKSGATAYLEAKTLLRRFKGEDALYDGRTNCPVYVGDKRATFVVSNYRHEALRIYPRRSYYYARKFLDMFYFYLIRHTELIDSYLRRFDPERFRSQEHTQQGP
ncbi:MAG: FAD-dependent oxidoreductase [Thermoplasmata archaeon]|jgi:sulfide:quinone oxidoreductase